MAIFQITWRSEISIEFEKMRNESANLQNLHQLQRLDEELIQRRKEELKYEKDITYLIDCSFVCLFICFFVRLIVRLFVYLFFVRQTV